MSPPGRPKGELRSAQHEGSPVSRFVALAPVLLLLATGLASTAARSADAPARSASSPARAADKILTPQQLRDCLALQTRIRQQDAEAERQKEALGAEKAEIARDGDALATQLASLDRTNADAVAAYNQRAQARDARIDAYEAAIDRYNARAAAFNADQDALTKGCNNRRFLEDDANAIKKGK